MVSSPSKRRLGFTLIELLVVIAIIAVLIGLLLPAVQKVRDSAANTQCKNNLKQMGLAANMYNEQKKTLPAGWVTSRPAGAIAPSPGWSWSLLLLPNLEQGNIYTTLNPDVQTPGAPPAANATLQTPLSVFRCPADTAQDINTNLQSYGMSNYVINREVVGPGRTDGSNTPNPLSIQGIPDGSSNTILIGERDSVNNIGAIWGVRSSVTSASFEGRPGSGINPIQGGGVAWTTGSNQRLAFNSMHSGATGVNFLFADGSVHFINNSVPADPNDVWTNFPANKGTAALNYVLQNLIHPNDGFAIGNY